MAEFEVKGEEKYCESEMEEKGLRFSFIELLCNSPTQFTFGCECFPQISFFVSIILYLNFLFTPSFPLQVVDEEPGEDDDDEDRPRRKSKQEFIQRVTGDAREDEMNDNLG